MTDDQRSTSSAVESNRATPRHGPTMSVIVPTHHRPVLLLQTMRSILAQTMPDIELIVVFDGIDDEAARGVAALRDPRIRCLVHPEALGVGRARNAGLGLARGRWVAFCDDDDLWAPDKLARQLAALDEAPAARWCVTSELRLWDGGRLGPMVSCPDPAHIAELLRSANVVPGGGSGVVVDRELIVSVGGFDEGLSMFADWDLWLRLSAVAAPTAVDAPLVVYRDHPAAMSRDMSGVERELERLHRRHDDDSTGADFSTVAVREWCLDRTLAIEHRWTRFRALREVIAQQRPSRAWTMGAALRLAAPRSLVRYVRRAEHRRWESSETHEWVVSLIGESPPPPAEPLPGAAEPNVSPAVAL